MKKTLKIIGAIVIGGIGLYAAWWAYLSLQYGQDLPLTTITVNGVEREYHAYVPVNPPPGPMSLLVVLSGGSAGSWPFPQQANFLGLAEQEGIIYAHPIGKLVPPNEGAWQLNTTSGSMQDIDMVEALIDDLSAKYAVDPARIYAVGYSLGSMFSYELACHLDDRFAAIASFAGTMPVSPSDCEPERNVPLMHLHGIDDPIIAYANTWEWKGWDAVGTMRNIPGLIDFWQDRYNCRDQVQNEGDGYLHIVHEGCDQGSRVEHYRIESGGHEWPASLSGVPTYDVIWSFLSSFSMTSVQAGTVTEVESRARDIHERVLVLDAHADIVPLGTTSRYGDADGSSQVATAKLIAGGVDAVVLSVAVGSGPRTPQGDAQAREIADTEMAAVAEIADAHDRVAVVRSASELVAAHARGDTSIMIGLQNARILEGNIAAIDEFYAAGARVFALTHLGHNDFADSSRPVYISATQSYEPTEEHGGLSALGRSAIERINELGALVDVSQLSVNATLQAVELSATPVIASHSNVRALSQVARNLADAEIDLIGEKDGVVHVAAFTAYLLDLSDADLIDDIKAVRAAAGIDERYTYPYELYWEIEDSTAQAEFLTNMRELLGPATVARMVDHIDYIVDRIGIDHVGVGNDFNHGGGIQGFGGAAEAVNLTIALVKRGYAAEDIEKIWSGNFIRVLRAAERHGSGGTD